MENHKKTRVRKNDFSNICNTGFNIIIQTFYVIGITVCGFGILNENISYGTMIAVLQLVGQIHLPLGNVIGYIPKFYSMLASAERLWEIEQAEIDEKYKTMENIIEYNKSNEEMVKFYDKELEEIIFENIYFRYKELSECDKKDKNVLNDININIRKGEFIAIVGPSGCGKSTILKLLLCLYYPDKGNCWIRKLSGMKKIRLDSTYRCLFAYVPQGNYLMSGTIREIVTFYDEEAMLDEKRIWEALEIACAKQFVEKLPMGMDTMLSERGTGLSEGQKQRIAIARALFTENPVLLLDEVTSALDENTEKQLLLNIKSMTNKTVLIVTHRADTLKICDKQILLTEGRCKELIMND